MKSRLNDESVEAVHSLIAEAAMDGGAWNACLDRLSRLFGDAICTITTFGQAGGVSQASARLDPEYWRKYNQHYRSLDPHAAAMPASPRLGQVLIAEAMVPEHQLVRTDYYHGLMKSIDIHYGAGVVLRAAPEEVEVFSLFRPKRKGSLRSEEERALGKFGVSLRVARTVHHRLNGLVRQKELLEQVVAASGQAVLVCDEACRLVFASAEAWRLISTSGVLSLSNGLFRINHPLSARRLASAMSARKPTLISVPRPWPSRDLMIEVAPLRRGETLLRISDPDETNIDAAQLEATLGLSAAESRVAALVGAGLTTPQIAARLRVQENTVRAHLKSIYGKTGVEGRAQLAGLVIMTGHRTPSGSSGEQA